VLSNTSETQLRSRLKKWRVTKSSRQTRKKSYEPTTETMREMNFPQGQSNNSPPKPRMRVRSLPTTVKDPATEPEWYKTNRHYESHSFPATMHRDGHDIPTVWAPASTQPSPLSSPSKSRVNTHGYLKILTTSSYDPSQASPFVDRALLSPTPAMSPAYIDPSYSLAKESCMQTSLPTAAVPPIQRAMPRWYAMPMGASTRATPMPFYITGPLTPPIDPMMQMVPPQCPQHMSDFQEDVKSWNRTMSSPYGRGMATRMNHNIRQQTESLERKVSSPSKVTTNQPTSGIVTPTSPYFLHGQYSILSSPGSTYPGPESLR
jgi:hypothetical protein